MLADARDVVRAYLASEVEDGALGHAHALVLTLNGDLESSETASARDHVGQD
jgi:hypothetical protein